MHHTAAHSALEKLRDNFTFGTFKQLIYLLRNKR